MNDGFINEDKLINYINNNNFNQDLPFSARKIAKQQKPDICINHNNTLKYISVKKGSGNSVHQEKIEVFFPYCERIIGASQLNYLKLFHYGDNTTDDSGSTRYNASEAKIRYIEEISKLNNVLNEPINLVKFIDRFLFVGNIGSTYVDVIYHGNIDSGLWASREEIIEYIINQRFPTNAVHFGPLTYQVWGRNENWTAVHPDRRYVMQVKWGSIIRDLEEIRRGND